eukprot:1150342-Pelagomonas_calceolata.AAC.16
MHQGLGHCALSAFFHATHGHPDLPPNILTGHAYHGVQSYIALALTEHGHPELPVNILSEHGTISCPKSTETNI